MLGHSGTRVTGWKAAWPFDPALGSRTGRSVPGFDGPVDRGHLVGEPDAVVGPPEEAAIGVERGRVHLKERWAAVPPAHALRRLHVRRQMDVETAHRLQAFGQDHLEARPPRAVPWTTTSGGSAGASCRSTATEWPCAA